MKDRDMKDKDKDDRSDVLHEVDDLSGEELSYPHDALRMGLVGLNVSLSSVSLDLGFDDFAPRQGAPTSGVDAEEGEEDEPNEEEQAAIIAHLARWSQTDRQQRKSMRQRRAVSTIAPPSVPEAEASAGSSSSGLLRRLSTLRRPGAGARHSTLPVSSPTDSTLASRHPSHTALAPVPTSPQPNAPSSEIQSPQAPSSPPGPQILSTEHMAGLSLLPDHQEVDMTPYPTKSSKGKSKDTNPLPGTNDNTHQPRPTSQKPLVTAGPAPARSMSLHPPSRDLSGSRSRGRDSNRLRSDPFARSASLSVSPNPPQSAFVPRPPGHVDTAPENPRQRGVWLTDIFCCLFTSSHHEDNQAGRTNPFE